jgi:two-component system, LuxR family, response regulator FixJ
MEWEDTDYQILVVDDDDAVRDSLMTVLGTVYLNVADFASGREFLSTMTLRERNCLILDIHMPQMTGIDVLREMAVREISIPTILISGRPDSVLRSFAEGLGAVALFDKPLEHESLIAAINLCLSVH